MMQVEMGGMVGAKRRGKDENIFILQSSNSVNFFGMGKYHEPSQNIGQENISVMEFNVSLGFGTLYKNQKNILDCNCRIQLKTSNSENVRADPWALREKYV